MFNTHAMVLVEDRRPTGPTHVTVNEHRAPTDDSIRLAREYEEKAWQHVAQGAVQGLRGIEADALVVDQSPIERKVMLFFKLNGKPVRVTIPLDEWKDDPITALHKAVAHEVANLILMTAANDRAIRRTMTP